MPAERFRSFGEFWPYYLREHSAAGCRALHYVGSTLALVAIALAIYQRNAWWLLAALAVGYGLAWIGHFGIERNRPATFKYPLWSFAADWKMWSLMITGRLGAELERHGIAPVRR